ncbi:hypothetical protein ACU4GD_32790 [Cupriavidus basilensis]
MRTYRTAEGTTQSSRNSNGRNCSRRCSSLDSARRTLRIRPAESRSEYARLFAPPGGGGVSQSQVESKRIAAVEAENALQIAQSRLAELDSKPSQEFNQATVQLEGSSQELTNLRIQYDAALREDRQYGRHSCGCRSRPRGWWPRRRRASASRISTRTTSCHDTGRAAGVITDVTSQRSGGDKVQANTPLGGIAPKDARPVLKIAMAAERDRAFLREGLPVEPSSAPSPTSATASINGNTAGNTSRRRPSWPARNVPRPDV